MTDAYICNKCNEAFRNPESGDQASPATIAPSVEPNVITSRDGLATLHLCPECYKELESWMFDRDSTPLKAGEAA